MDNRLIEIAKNLENWKIGLDDTFDFKCRGCGKCCKNREDVMLTSRDLFIIARHLGKTPGTIITEFCECYIGQDSRIPIVRIRPRGVNNACPFLIGKRCQIYTAKPTVCALFPIGRVLVSNIESIKDGPPTYSAGYILQPAVCGSRSKTQTIRQWLDKSGVPADDTFYSEWNAAIIHFSMSIHDWEERISKQVMRQLQNVLVELIYVQYDTEQEFLPQFKNNMREAKEFLNVVKTSELLRPKSGGGDSDQ